MRTSASRQARLAKLSGAAWGVGGLAAAILLSACRRDASAPERGSASVSGDASSLATEAAATLALHPGRPGIVPGAPFTVRVEFRVPEGWHTYWENPGETGLAPSIAWRLPAGLRSTGLRLPVPQRFEDEGIVSLGFGEPVCFLAEFEADEGMVPGEVQLEAHVDWMICKEMCVPVRSAYALPVPVEPGARDLPEDPATATWRSRLPLGTEGWKVSVRHAGGRLGVTVEPGGEGPVPAADRWPDLYLFPLRNAGLDLSIRPVWTRNGAAWTASVGQGSAPYAAGDTFAAVLATGRRDDWQGWSVSAVVEPGPVDP